MYRSLIAVTLIAFTAPVAAAQSLGTYRWQTQPYCNVLTLAVTQTAGVYSLDGFDDQCGATTKAPVTGTAVPNADGTVQFGLTIVTSPGGKPVHLTVPVNTGSFGGAWRDDAGNTGTFSFGTTTGGSPRPAPRLIDATAIDATQVQRRIAGGCSSGGVFHAVGQDGTPRCKPGIERTTSGAADLSHMSGFVMSQLSQANTGIPWTGHGRRLMWYPGKAAFRVGEAIGQEWDDASVGMWSIGMGHHVTASGNASVAIGANAYALADSGVALGYNVAAVGTAAVALGSDARSDTGAFTFADRSVSSVLASGPNEFNVRATGGVGFYTNRTLTAGVEMKSGASAWSVLSDVNRKEHFRDLDDADVLGKLARMPIREWNYKAQDAAIRHVGPTAQDFHAAFGLGEDPLRISTIDADGIALRAIQALEARTRAEHAVLARENAALKDDLRALSQRLVALEQRPR